MVAPDRVLSMGKKKLNCILMLNWISWNGAIFECLTVLFETTYTKLNSLK